MHCIARCFFFCRCFACQVSTSPITLYATKPEVEQSKDRLDFINFTEIGEAQAMMEMVRHEYIGNLQHVSTDIIRMHMTQSFGTNNTISTVMLIT
jgi:hypothetical protein